MVSSHLPSFVHVLHEKLLASPSATAVLRELYGDPVIIERMPASGRAATPEILALLSATDRAGIVHRHVRLRAAGTIASEADLFYVPARLLPGMAQTLTDTNTPFGTVVAPMNPTRETIFTRFGHLEDPVFLVHHAVLRDSAGMAIACVFENYLGGA